MRRALAFAGVLALAACGGAREQQDAAARSAMIPVVTQALTQQFPGQEGTSVVARCIAANATDEETFVLVEAALRGVSGRDTQLVLAIGRRPETRACVRDAGVSGFF